MTPILGAILSAWAYEHESSNTVFKFNQYTFPTFFLMGVCVVATLLLHAVFVDVVRGPSALKASSDIDDSLSVRNPRNFVTIITIVIIINVH